MYTFTEPTLNDNGVWVSVFQGPDDESPCTIYSKGKIADVKAKLKKTAKRMNEIYGAKTKGWKKMGV